MYDNEHVMSNKCLVGGPHYLQLTGKMDKFAIKLLVTHRPLFDCNYRCLKMCKFTGKNK